MAKRKQYIKYILGAGIIYNGVKSFIDNVFRPKVKPKIGSVVYCSLIPSVIEHSGIYVGDNEIIHLNRLGYIEKVSIEKFIEKTPSITIYVSSRNGDSVGNIKISDRALSKLGKKLKYNIVNCNCHQFSSSCITGIIENNDRLLT